EGLGAPEAWRRGGRPPPGAEAPGGRRPAGGGEGGLRPAEAFRELGDEIEGERQAALDRRRVDGDRLECAFPAHPTGRRGVEAAPQALRIETGRVDLDDVRRQIVRRSRGARRDSLGETKPEPEVLVVP